MRKREGWPPDVGTMTISRCRPVKGATPAMLAHDDEIIREQSWLLHDMANHDDDGTKCECQGVTQG